MHNYVIGKQKTSSRCFSGNSKFEGSQIIYSDLGDEYITFMYYKASINYFAFIYMLTHHLLKISMVCICYI